MIQPVVNLGFVCSLGSRPVVTLRGRDGLDLLQRLSTNDLSRQKEGESLQTVLTTEKGRIVDVVSVFRVNQTNLLLVGESSETEALVRWIEKYIIMEAATVEIGPTFEHLVICGTGTTGYLESVLRSANNQFRVTEKWGSLTRSRVLVDQHKATEIIERLRDAGVRAISLAEYEEHRVLNAIPKSPNELCPNYNPLEAGLDHLVSWTKGCYIGQEVIARLDTYKKVQRRLVRLSLGTLPDELPALLLSEEAQVGEITSAVPVHGEVAAVGYLKVTYDASHPLFFVSGTGRVSARIVDESAWSSQGKK